MRGRLDDRRWSTRNRTLAWLIALILCLPLASANATAPPPLPQTSNDKLFAAGSYIIDAGAGVTAGVQDDATAMEAYGLIYRLLVDAKVPVYWIIKNGKQGEVQTAPSTADPLFADLTTTVKSPYNATTATITKSYFSGPFVIPAEYMDDVRLAALISKATALTSVRVDKATASFSAPVYDKINYWPKATLDATNGSIAKTFYDLAKIGGPASGASAADQLASTSFNWKNPSELDGCDDIFVMPHADPTWLYKSDTQPGHANLLTWNDVSGGYIWAGCHAVSVLENLQVNDATTGVPAMNFLSTEGLYNYGLHGDGTPPYWYGVSQGVTPDLRTVANPALSPGTSPTTLADRSDPIMQFIGATSPAQTNGSEQIYMPNPETKYPTLTGTSQWRNGVRFVAWDPTQADVTETLESPGVAAAAVYGRAFDDPTNGLVMYEGAHNINTGDTGTAAMRAFFNFVLLSGIENAPQVKVSMPTETNVRSGETVTLTTELSGGSGPYDYTWKSTCGGTFTNGTGVDVPAGTYTTQFTAPIVDMETGCQLRAEVADACGRDVFDAGFVVILPKADVAITKTASPAVAPAGTDITYTLTATNTGPSTALGVVVTDALPAGVTYVSASDNPTVSSDSKTLTWNLGSLAKDATKTLTVTVRAGTTAGTVTNTAAISTTSYDPVPTNNTATANTQIVNSSLAVTKVASPTLIDRDGGQVTFTFQVRNTGQNPLHDVQISDNPVCTMSARAGDTNNDGVLPAPVNGMDVEVWTYTCSPTVNATTDFDPTTPGVQDKVTVTALDNGNYQISGTATATVTLAAPFIAVDKKLWPADQKPAPGQPAIFKIVVTNTGNVPLTNVSLADTWDAAPSQPPYQCTTGIPNLAVGESYTLVCAAKMPLTPTWGTLASDNFDNPATPHATDSYKNGTGWPTNSVWDEEGATDSAIAGDIQVVTATLPAGGTSSNVLRISSNKTYIQRTIPTVTRADSVKLAFNYFRSEKFNGGANDIDVMACTDAAAATCPIIATISKRATTGADDAWQSFGPIILPVGTTAIRFDPQDDLRTDKYFYIDNVVVTSADFINNVTATGTDPFNDTVTNTASSGRITPGTSSLSITKSAIAPSDGFPLHNTDPFTYTVTVQNTGTVWQTGVVVTDELPDGLVPTNGQSVTASKTLFTQRSFDGFGSTGTPAYSSGWLELTDTAQSATAGITLIKTDAGKPAYSLWFDKAGKIQKTVDLSGATAGAIRFDCKRESTADANLTLTVTGQTGALVSTTVTPALCPTTGTLTDFRSTGYYSLPTAALVSGAVITLEVTGTKDVWVDNLEIITTTGAPTSVPAGTPPTLSTTGGYTLAPNETITFTVPVTVLHGSDNGTSFVNYATADSNQSDPVTAAVTTPYVAPNTLRIVRIEKQALNCDTNQQTCPLTGAEFTLYTSDPLAPNPVEGVALTPDALGTTFTTADLRVERDYWIVETKAPDGFQLLAQPIKFRFTETQLELDAVSASSLVTTSALITPTSGTPYFTLTVTNLPAAADLPEAGGEGSLPFLALGLLLVAGATTYYRMTSRPPIPPRRAM